MILKNKIGYWASLLTTVFAIIYIVPQLIQGMDMPATKTSLTWILTPSLFLAPSFMIMMVAIHYYAKEEKKIWSHIGTMFAGAYFIFVSIVYFTVLSVTMPHMLSGEADQVALLQYVPKSFLTGIDVLGYTSMSLATFFTAFVFGNTKLERWTRWVFIANGIITPIILLTQWYPNVAYAGAFWIVSLPLSSVLTMLVFKHANTAQASKPRGKAIIYTGKLENN